MYSRFLEEAGYEQSALAAEAAERWTQLAGLAREASEPERPDAATWRRLGAEAERVLDAEDRLWVALAAA